MSFKRSEVPSTVSKRWSPLTKQLVIIGTLVAVVWALFRFSSVLPPLILASILAYLLIPLVNWVHRHSILPRALILVFVYILLLLLIGLTAGIIIPTLVGQFIEFGQALQSVVISAVEQFEQPVEILGYTIEPPDFTGQLTSTIQNLITPIAGNALGLVLNVASSLFGLVLVLVLSFYLIKDSHAIGRYLRGLIPIEYRPEVFGLGQEIEQIWASFFRGQIILAGIIAGVTMIVTTALGLRNSVVLGLLAGILEVIPTFGPIIAAIPAVLLALFQGPAFLPVSNTWFAVIVIGAYVLIQQVENNVLVPRIIGGSVRLHPAVILLGAVAGASFGGILGIFLAAPVIATLRVLVRYGYRKVLDLEPFGEGLTPVVEPVIHGSRMIGGQEIEAVVFHLDGVLVELTDESWEQAPAAPAEDVEEAKEATEANIANEAEGAEGAEAPEEGEPTPSLRPGERLRSLLGRVGLAQPASVIRDRLSQRRGAVEELVYRPAKGIDELMEYLCTRFKLGLMTTRTRSQVDPFLDKYGYETCFYAIVSQESSGPAVSYSRLIHIAADKMQVPVERCAVVGGSRAVIDAANYIGAVSVAVLDGSTRRQDLGDADLVLDSIEQLRNWL